MATRWHTTPWLLAGILSLSVGSSRPLAAPLADPAPADTQAVPVARWPDFPLLPDGRFPIGAWCAPPARQNTDARYAEYARAGFNVTFGMLEDPFLPAPSLARLEVSRRHHVYAVVRDKRVDPDEAERPGWRAKVDSTVRAYSSQPALLGYFLADEPGLDIFPSLAALNRRFAQRDSRHPGYANLLGFPAPGPAYGAPFYTEFLRRYLRQVRPTFFTFDHYSLLEGSDAPYFITGLDSIGLVSRETGVPFWAILQLTPHLHFRKLTPAELAWQAYLAMAHGARGIVWFTYWTPNPAESFHYRDGPITYDGRRTAAYAAVAQLNPRLQALGKELSPFRSLGVRYTGPVPYGCKALADTPALRIQATAPLAVGFFRGPEARTYALLVNRDYRRTSLVRLSTRGSFGRWRRSTGYYRSVRPGAVIMLEPGDAELVRLPKDYEYID